MRQQTGITVIERHLITPRRTRVVALAGAHDRPLEGPAHIGDDDDIELDVPTEPMGLCVPGSAAQRLPMPSLPVPASEKTRVTSSAGLRAHEGVLGDASLEALEALEALPGTATGLEMADGVDEFFESLSTEPWEYQPSIR